MHCWGRMAFQKLLLDTVLGNDITNASKTRPQVLIPIIHIFQANIEHYHERWSSTHTRLWLGRCVIEIVFLNLHLKKWLHNTYSLIVIICYIIVLLARFGHLLLSAQCLIFFLHDFS